MTSCLVNNPYILHATILGYGYYGNGKKMACFRSPRTCTLRPKFTWNPQTLVFNCTTIVMSILTRSCQKCAWSCNWLSSSWSYFSEHYPNSTVHISWPEIPDIATAHARGYLTIWPPHSQRKCMAEMKQNKIQHVLAYREQVPRSVRVLSRLFW